MKSYQFISPRIIDSLALHCSLQLLLEGFTHIEKAMDIIRDSRGSSKVYFNFLRLENSI